MLPQVEIESRSSDFHALLATIWTNSLFAKSLRPLNTVNPGLNGLIINFQTLLGLVYLVHVQIVLHEKHHIWIFSSIILQCGSHVNSGYWSSIWTDSRCDVCY